VAKAATDEVAPEEVIPARTFVCCMRRNPPRILISFNSGGYYSSGAYKSAERVSCD